MIKKIMTGLAVAATALMVSFSTPVFNQAVVTAEAAGKVLSMEEAAKKLLKTAYKAHDQKKKITTSVTIECLNKKSVEKYENELSKVVAKEELGEFYDVDDLRYTSRYRIHTRNKDGSYRLRDTYKNGKLTLKVIYDGKDKDWRFQNEQIIYGKQNMKELREVTEGMSEIDKAWRVAVWLMVDHKTKYDGRVNIGNNAGSGEKDVAKSKGRGNCQILAGMYSRYANRIGIKVGSVSSNDHVITCVKVDGKIYYTDMQGVDVDHATWSRAQDKDYNDENIDAGFLVKYVPDPTDRWLKVPQGYAEEIETGYITKYPWEVSEGEWCWLTEKQAKATLPETGFGKSSKWKYKW